MPPGEYKTRGQGERIAEPLPFRLVNASGVVMRCYCRDESKCQCVERILTTYRVALA